MNNYNNFNQSYGRHDNFVSPQRNDWMPSYNNQPISNKIYVTSLEDALNRPAGRGSEMVYFHQDLNEFYVIKTDYDGRKSWMGFNYNIPNQDENTPATKADFKELLNRIEKLEGRGEVTDNVELNG